MDHISIKLRNPVEHLLLLDLKIGFLTMLLEFYNSMVDSHPEWTDNPPLISFYKYVGEKGGGGSASITISATEHDGPSPGAMWWNQLTGDLLLYYDDGDSQQWVSAISGAGGLWSLDTATSTISTPYTVAAGSTKV